MATCGICGNPVQFVMLDGRAIPLHLSGRCNGPAAGQGGDRRVRSEDSFCRPTRCPECGDAVFFVRHNGGSVYLDPPLGAPWSRHPCMPPKPKATKAGGPAKGVLPPQSVLDALAQVPGLITGVAVQADLGPKRKYTVLTIEVGELAPLKLFVRGGADALVGGLVVIDPKQRHVHPIEDAALPFRVMAALAIPAAYAELLARLSDTSAVVGFKRQFEPTQPKLNQGPLRKYRQQGFGGDWKIKQRLGLIELLQGQEKREAIHAAAMAVLEWGEAHGDVSAAAQLVNMLLPATRRQVIEWFRLFSPVMFNLKCGEYVVRVRKSDGGSRAAYQLVAARAKPFFKLDMPASMPNARKS